MEEDSNNLRDRPSIVSRFFSSLTVVRFSLSSFFYFYYQIQICLKRFSSTIILELSFHFMLFHPTYVFQPLKIVSCGLHNNCISNSELL